MAITKEGESQDFNYTGGIQSFIVPVGGLYKLEVWGAQGTTAVSGSISGIGGYGGYSYGYITLTETTSLYVVVGGKGNYTSGGYNGGGSGVSEDGTTGGGGGGATHITKGTNRGELASYVNNKNEILIVAGGGGGGVARSSWNYVEDRDDYHCADGGSGGGASGGIPIAYSWNSDTSKPSGIPQTDVKYATQTTGCAFGVGGGGATSGGGGGWYGGYSCSNWSNGGGGGSGYIGGVPAITYKGTTYSPSTSNGARSGNGFARITLIKKAMPATLYLGGLELTGIFVGNNEIKSAFLGDKDLG